MITKEWLEKRYIIDVADVKDIATEAECSVHNIRRLLRKYQLQRGKAFQKGKPAWNTGLTKNDDPRLAKLSEDRKGNGNPMFGVSAWNAGLTKETDERVKITADKITGLSPSEKTREKMRNAKLGLRGEKTNHYVKGTSIWPNGYEVTLIDGESIYTHRLVAEKSLGRKLTTDEDVHHFDKNKLNNDPLNLVVLNKAVHSSLHSAGLPDNKIDQINWLTDSGHKFELVG